MVPREAEHPEGEDDRQPVRADADEPIHRMSLVAILIASTNDALVACMLFPFVPFMVASFGVHAEHVGFYVGLLAASYNIAAVPAGIFWGRLSDSWGRRRVLVIELSMTMITVLAFGVSRSLGQAVAARSLGGLLGGGSQAVARAMMTDITTDANRSKGFAYLGTAYGAGFLLGPLVGGMLSRPADLLPSIFGGTIFEEPFPYLLPCCATAASCVAGLLFLVHIPSLRSTVAKELSSIEMAPAPECPRWSPVANGDEKGLAVVEAVSSTSTHPKGDTIMSTTLLGQGRAPAKRRTLITRKFLTGGVMVNIYAQSLLNFVVISMQELVPLFYTNVLRMEPSHVGLALAPLGLSLCLSPFLFNFMDRRIGTPACFRLGILGFCVVIGGLIPSLRALQSAASTAVFWCGLIGVAVCRALSGFFAFTSASILLNALLTSDVGLMNGVQTSLSALSRAFAPLFIGLAYDAMAERACFFLAALCLGVLEMSRHFHVDESRGQSCVGSAWARERRSRFRIFTKQPQQQPEAGLDPAPAHVAGLGGGASRGALAGQ